MKRWLRPMVRVLVPILCLAAAPPPLQSSPREADEQAALIDGLHERGLHAMVETEAERFLARHDRHAAADRVRYRLGLSLFELGRYAEAAPHFARLGDQSDFAYRAEADLRFGQCALETGDTAAAARALRRVLDSEADYLTVPATFLLAECDYREGRFDRAEPGYESVVAADTQGAYGTDAIAALAWCAHRLGRHDQAIERAERLDDDVLDANLAFELAYLVGEAHRAAGRPVDAVAAYRAVDAGPFAPAALRGRAFAHADAGDHRPAADAFDRLRREFPDGEFAREAALHGGIHLLLDGDASGAWKALADKRLVADAETLYWRGRAAASLGRADQALALLTQAQAGKPSEELRGHIASARGDLLSAAGRTAEAAAAYEQAGSPAALHAAAVASFNAGDAARALELTDAALARAADDLSARLTRAEALFALERFKEAESDFRRVVAGSAADDGRRPRALSRQAWCRYLGGDSAAAARLFGQLVTEHPQADQAAEARFMEGRSARESDDEQRTIAAWSRYLTAHPDGEHGAEVLAGLAEIEGGEVAQRHLSALVTRFGDSELAPRALLDLGEARSADGDPVAAARHYGQLLQRFPDDPLAPAARYGMAWCAVEDADLTAADRLLTPFVAAAEATPERHAALELLVWCRQQSGNPAGAEEAWRALRTMDPADPRVTETARMVAQAWTSAGEPARALAVLDLTAGKGDATRARIEAAWVALDAGDLEGAQERVDALAGADVAATERAEVAFFLGEACFERGLDAQAVQAYAAACAVPDHPLLDASLYKLGFTLLRTDEPEQAIAPLRRLVEEFADSTLLGESLFLMGEAAFRSGEFAAAVGPLQRLLTESPGHEVAARARFRLGLSLGQVERWAECEAVLSDLARLHTDFEHRSEAELWRGRALAALGNARGARAAFQRVIDDDRGLLAARALIGIGQTERSQGQVESALSTFLRVAVLYGHEQEVAQALLFAGECLEDLGDREKADDRYREILERHPDADVAAQARRRLSRR